VFVPANQDLLLDDIDHADCRARPPGVFRRASHGDFWIDRDTVSCADYRRCVAAGRCDDTTYGCLDRVRVTQSQANVYCAWVGAHLASYVEWMGAQYKGGGGVHFHEEGACSGDTDQLGWPRCTKVTERGFAYTVKAFERGEWTSELGCVNPDGTLDYMIIQPSNDWFSTSRTDFPYEFRCARLAKP
jgi:hypothetical protein